MDRKKQKRTQIQRHGKSNNSKATREWYEKFLKLNGNKNNGKKFQISIEIT